MAAGDLHSVPIKDGDGTTRQVQFVEQADGTLASANVATIKGSNIRHAHAVTAGASELAGVSAYGSASMIWVGGTGNVTLTLDDDSSVQFTNVAAGMWHAMPFFTHVTAASATDIRAGY